MVGAPGRGKDDAREAHDHDLADTLARGGAGGHAAALRGRIAGRAGRAAVPAVPSARTIRSRSRACWVAAPRPCVPARCRSHIRACSSSTSSPSSGATRSKGSVSRSRTARVVVTQGRRLGRVPRPFHPGGRREPVPVRVRGRPATALPLPARSCRSVPPEAVRAAPRPHRSAVARAEAHEAGAHGQRAGRDLGSHARPGAVGPRPPARPMVPSGGRVQRASARPGRPVARCGSRPRRSACSAGPSTVSASRAVGSIARSRSPARSPISRTPRSSARTTWPRRSRIATASSRRASRVAG